MFSFKDLWGGGASQPKKVILAQGPWAREASPAQGGKPGPGRQAQPREASPAKGRGKPPLEEAGPSPGRLSRRDSSWFPEVSSRSLTVGHGILHDILMCLYGSIPQDFTMVPLFFFRFVCSFQHVQIY